MKTIKRFTYLFYMVLGVSLFSSCEKFLDKTPEAQASEKDVFGTYVSMQGFLDHNYAYLMDYMKTYMAYTMYKGGECFKELYRSEGPVLLEGNYWLFIGPNVTDHYWQTGTRGYGYGLIEDNDFGIWAGGWKGIRKSNVTLKNIYLMQDATEEEKNLIKGQAYFFRAYFHGDIMRSFGGIPYIDTVFLPTDEMKLNRLTYQESTEKVIADLDKAIPLLPKNWDETGPGSQRIGANTGRITKGAALAYKQFYLLYAGSPLMNAFSGNDYSYNVEYCKRAAVAGWEMIKLANEGYYSLMPFANYSRNFHNSNDGTVVWCPETILVRMDNTYGASYSYNHMRRQFLPQYMGGATVWFRTANQKIIDRFEMADGTRYKIEYDLDNNKRWQNRDPRFRYNFYVDRDKVGANVKSVWKGYYDPSDPEARPGNRGQTPYMIKKFISYNANDFDRAYTNLQCSMPLMRLAQVYLDYAEAVTAAYGPNGSAPGATLTAVDAINIVRARAGMPPVTATATGYNSFMDLVWNERTVELIFEAHYWFDIRRWHVSHLPEYKELVTLDFDKNWTYFNRRLWGTKRFDDPKHYWVPIYRDQVQLYKGFYQNPGWE